MFQKVNQILMIAFMVIGVILMVMTMGVELPEEGPCETCAPVGYFIDMSIFLLVIAILAALAGTAMTAAQNPKKMMGSAIGVVGMLVIVGISYALAGDEVLESYGSDITAGTSRWSGAGLIMFYILFVIALLSVAYSSVARLLK